MEKRFNTTTRGEWNVAAIPAQHRVTQQILSRWQPFKNLNQTFAVSRCAEQLRQRVQQRVVATVEDSSFTHRDGELRIRRRGRL